MQDRDLYARILGQDEVDGIMGAPWPAVSCA